MSTTAARAAAGGAIEKRFSDKWSAGPNTPIGWAALSFNAPTDGSPWIECAILWGGGHEFTMAGGGGALDSANQLVGVFQVSVFGPTGAGYGALDQLADRAAEIVARLTLAAGFITGSPAVHFRVPSGPRPVPNSDGFLQVVVDCPFEVYESLVAAP